MKMIYPEWEQQIVFEENKVNAIYLENSQYFRRILQDLCRQIEGGDGRFILSEGSKILPIKKNVDIIFSPFNIGLEDRKFYTEIYKQLQEQALGEEMFEKTQNTTGIMMQYILELIDLLPYSLEISGDIDYISFFKSMGIHIQHDSSDLVEVLIEYILLVRDIFKKNIFVFVNLRVYFTETEIGMIYQSILPEKIHIIDFEQEKKDYHLACECDIIIDTDLCEI